MGARELARGKSQYFPLHTTFGGRGAHLARGKSQYFPAELGEAGLEGLNRRFMGVRDTSCDTSCEFAGAAAHKAGHRISKRKALHWLENVNRYPAPLGGYRLRLRGTRQEVPGAVPGAFFLGERRCGTRVPLGTRVPINIL